MPQSPRHIVASHLLALGNEWLMHEGKMRGCSIVSTCPVCFIVIRDLV